MNLIELFNELSIPEGYEKKFNALPVKEFPNFRIAIDIDGNPVLLLFIENSFRNSNFKNFRFKHLELIQNVECKITENGSSIIKVFTVITFISSDKNLQEYFLRFAETLIKSIISDFTQENVINTLNKFVEVFRTLSDVPTKTIQGLWAEIFLIENSKNPKSLLDFWHNIPEEKFDFNSGENKIEVKSNSTFNRIHIFSSEQLNPPEDTQVLIASVFMRQSIMGLNIHQLIGSIISKIDGNIELINKLNSIVCKTLGNSFEQSIRIKYDYQLAKESLQFYKHQDVIKIEKINIPERISDVKYRSDLSFVNIITLEEFKVKNSVLFQDL